MVTNHVHDKLTGFGALAGLAAASTGASMLMGSEMFDGVEPHICGESEDLGNVETDAAAAAWNPLARFRRSKTPASSVPAKLTRIPMTTNIQSMNGPSIHLIGDPTKGLIGWTLQTNWQKSVAYDLLHEPNFKGVKDIASQMSAEKLNAVLETLKLTRHMDDPTQEAVILDKVDNVCRSLVIQYGELTGATCDGDKGVAIKDDMGDTMAEVVETKFKRTLRLSHQHAKEGFSGNFYSVDLKPSLRHYPELEEGLVEHLVKTLKQTHKTTHATYDCVRYNISSLESEKHIVHTVQNPKDLKWTFSCRHPGMDAKVHVSLGNNQCVDAGLVTTIPKPQSSSPSR